MHVLKIIIDVFDQLVGVWRFEVEEARWVIPPWAQKVSIHTYSLSQRAWLPVVRVVFLNNPGHDAEELVAVFVGPIHQSIWLGKVRVQLRKLQQRGNCLNLLLHAGNLQV